MEPSDEALVIGCRNGDRAAWETLVERYQRMIYSIARGAGLDEGLSADVFQAVFTTLVEHLGKIDQPAMIGVWLATTTRHEAWRVSRRERSARVAVGDSTEYNALIVDQALLPEDRLLRLEEQNRIYNMVQALDGRCRQLILLLFYRTDTPQYSEIATILGMNEGSVGPTRARCLQKIRRLLESSAE
jgi:RNA polymerase sigma factor (sigma-70 family)